MTIRVTARTLNDSGAPNRGVASGFLARARWGLATHRPRSSRGCGIARSCVWLRPPRSPPASGQARARPKNMQRPRCFPENEATSQWGSIPCNWTVSNPGVAGMTARRLDRPGTAGCGNRPLDVWRRDCGRRWRYGGCCHHDLCRRGRPRWGDRDARVRTQALARNGPGPRGRIRRAASETRDRRNRIEPRSAANTGGASSSARMIVSGAGRKGRARP